MLESSQNANKSQSNPKKYNSKNTKLLATKIEAFIKESNNLNNQNASVFNKTQLKNNFIKAIKTLIANGADPNVKTKDDMGLLIALGFFYNGKDEGMDQFKRHISDLKLDVNATYLGRPVVNAFYNSKIFEAASVLLEMGFALNTPYEEDLKRAKNKGHSNETQKNKKGSQEKKERPFYFNEFMYPQNTTEINWHYLIPSENKSESFKKVSVIEEGIARKHIAKFKTVEQHLAHLNDAGLKLFYLEKLKSSLIPQFDKLNNHTFFQQVRKLDNFKKENIESLLQKVKKGDPLSDEENRTLDLYKANEEVITKWWAIKRISDEIGSALKNDTPFNDEQAQIMIQEIQAVCGIDVKFDAIPDKITKNPTFYYRTINNEDKKLIDSQRAILNDAKQIIMFSHKLGIEGAIDLENDEYKFNNLGLDGFVIAHTLPAVRDSLVNFSGDALTAHLEGKEDASKLAHKELMSVIIEAFNTAEAPHNDKENVENWQATAQAYKQGKPVLFESRWEGHSAMTVVYKDRMYICNKGAGTSKPSIKCYKIGDPSSLCNEKAAEKFQQLSSFVRTDKRIIGELSGMLPGSARFANQEMMKELQLTRESLTPLKGQKIGNCSYTNCKRGADAILLAIEDRQRIDKGSPETYQYPKGSPPEWRTNHITAQIDKKERKALYHAFGVNDRMMAVNEYFARLEKIPHEKLRGSYKSYIDPLLIVLRDQNNTESKKNPGIGKEILKRLKKLEFSDKEIYNRMQALPNPTKYGEIGMRLLESFDASLDTKTRSRRRQQFLRLVLPGGQAYHSNEFLKKIGMNPDVLKPSRWEQIENAWLKMTGSSTSKEPKEQTIVQQPIVQAQSPPPPRSENAVRTQGTSVDVSKNSTHDHHTTPPPNAPERPSYATCKDAKPPEAFSPEYQHLEHHHMSLHQQVELQHPSEPLPTIPFEQVIAQLHQDVKLLCNGETDTVAHALFNKIDEISKSELLPQEKLSAIVEQLNNVDDRLKEKTQSLLKDPSVERAMESINEHKNKHKQPH